MMTARALRSSTPSARTELTGRDDYFTALADVFGITFAEFTAAERDDLWARLAAAHERWLAS